MFHGDEPIDTNPFARYEYKRMLASGEFLESIITCDDCSFGGTALVHLSGLRDMRCPECGSRSIGRTVMPISG